jgi:hypothetical protein
VNPPVQRFGDAVLLTGPAVKAARLLVERGAAQTMSQDGISMPPVVRLLLTELIAAAAMSAAGPDGRPQAEVPSQSTTTPLDALTTKEVAAVLNVSDRHVRRLITTLDGRRRSRDWVFSRAVVEAYRDNRQEHSA